MEVLRSRILLRPTDFGASLAFYEDTLGLHRSREFGRAPHRGVVLFLGSGEVELHEGGGEGVAPTGVRLWLQVRSLDDVAAELALAGVPLVEPPAAMPWGLHEATVHDPDGLPIVLVEVPADHPLRRDPRD